MKESLAGNTVNPVETFAARLERYYRFHAHLYDTTRWAFLFGRQALIKQIAAHSTSVTPTAILEVGCGTGKNIAALNRAFPTAEIVGMDLSAAMLARARRNIGISKASKRIELFQQAYTQPLNQQISKTFDLVVFSYTLSMINPGWEQVIESAYHDLEQGGKIAIVDFNTSHHAWFKRWMACNHVKMESHLWPALEARFKSLFLNIRPAYGGLWSYFVFLGEKR